MRRLAPVLAALLIGGPALAEPEAGRIRVIGRAQEERVPDFASVEIGVLAKGTTPAAALDTASNAARRIIDTAKALGVSEPDLGTSSVTLQPQSRMVRQPDGSTREQPDGYAAGNRVLVRLSDMARLGELMRRALDAGANSIDGVSFGLRDPVAAEASVQIAAMKDARAQAERLSEAAGVKLGAAFSIASPPHSEGARGTPFAAVARAAPAPRGKAPVPVEAGSIATSAEVEAVFAIAP